MPDLTDLHDIIVPSAVLDPTLRFLAEQGAARREGFVVWGAKFDDGQTLRFTSCYVPEQTAHSTPDGLLVTVDGQALHRMNQAFYARGELAAGQVHTHPTDAYHSETDDHYPLVTQTGAVSLVIPDFATRGRDALDDWAWYRLVSHGVWEPLTAHIHLDRNGA